MRRELSPRLAEAWAAFVTHTPGGSHLPESHAVMPDAAFPSATEVVRLSRHASFLHFAASRMLSGFGMQATTIALGWLVYDRTQNAFLLGFIGLCQFLPQAVLTFLVGHVADRFDRRRIGLACQMLEATTLVVLCAGLWGNFLSVPMIFGMVVALGAARAFEQPTMASLLPSVVPEGVLQQAIATSTSVIQTAQIVGPALGGLLYGIGPIVPFAFAAGCFLIAGVNVALISAVRNTARREPVSFKSVFAGVSFIRSRPVMLGTISLDLFAVLLGGATAMLPIFARDILDAGPWALGLLRAAPAVGALGMSIVLARHPLRRRVGRKMLMAVTIFGIATILFAFSRNIALSVMCLFVLGAADTVSVVVRSSLVQLLTPDAMRGRVNAVNSLFIGTSNQLGEFESGMLAGFLGPVASAAIGGVGTIVVVLLWTRLFPQLAKVETLAG
jgi:MFS family permease